MVVNQHVSAQNAEKKNLLAISDSVTWVKNKTMKCAISLGAKNAGVNHNHDHPKNGWYAQGLKAQVTGQRLKTLAFTLFKPNAIVAFAAP